MTVTEALELYINSSTGISKIKNECYIKPQLNSFINKYDAKTIKDLKLDEYCVGKQSLSSFCYQIERGDILSQYGSIRGSSSMMYNVWYEKSTREPIARIIGSKGTTYDVNQIEKIFNETKDAIVETIESLSEIHNGDFTRYNEAGKILYDNFQSKIAFLYDSDNQIPIYSYSHLYEILKALNINPIPKDRLKRRMMLFDYYEKNIKSKPKFITVTPYVFMCFVYDDHYGYTNGFLKDETVSEEQKLNPISEFDVKVVKAVPTDPNKDSASNTSKKSAKQRKEKPNPPTPDQDKNIQTGKDGEQYVEEFLKKLVNDNKISDLKRQSGTWSEECDFEFTYKGRTIYVDVKTSSYDTRDHVHLFLSSGEFNKLAANKDNYYIFFVSDIYSNPKPPIRIVSYDDINNNKEDVSYFVDFKYQETNP